MRDERPEKKKKESRDGADGSSPSMAMLQAVCEKGIPPAKRKKWKSLLEKHIDQACRILGMIHHFRVMEEPFQRTSTGPQTSLQDSLYQIFRAMQYEFPNKKMMVIKKISPKVNYLPVERNYFEAVLFQLIQHAHAFMENQDGVIEIESDEKWYMTQDHKTYTTFALTLSYSAQGLLALEDFDFLHPWDDAGPEWERLVGMKMGLYAASQWVKHLGGRIGFVSSSPESHQFLLEFRLAQ